MPAVALFAFSLIAAAQQSGQTPPPEALTGRPVGQPAAAGLGAHVQRAAPPDAPPQPDPPLPQEHEIKAVTGNEGGHPHIGGTAESTFPKPTVQFRTAPTEPTPPPTAPAAPDAEARGRPVGQPAAAGLGAHVQRGPAARDERAGRSRPDERAPD